MARKRAPKVEDIEGLEEKVKKGKSRTDIPVIRLESDAVQRFTEIKSQIKALEEVAETLKKGLVSRGLEEVFTRNIQDPENPVSSVFFESGEADANGNVPRVMFTWTTSHNKFTIDAVAAVLTDPEHASIKDPVDPNNYVAWGSAAEFDAKVFVVDGKFNHARFNAFKLAVDGVAKELSVASPLSVYKAPVVVQDADTRRFKELSFSGNMALSTVFPTTLKLEPVVPKAE